MNQRLWDAGRVFVVAIGCAATLATFVQAAVHSQGISAQATVKPSDPTRDVATLRQQVLALEKRVAELEKEELEKFKGDDLADDAAARKLEQRLAKLEGAQQTAKNDGKTGTKPDAAGDDKPMTVRVPFVVQDKSGRTIFEVDTSADGRPIVVVSSSLGAAAILGIDPLGKSSLRLFNAQHASVRLSAESEGGALSLENKTRKEAVTLSVDRGNAGLVKVFSAAGRAVTALSSNASGGQVLVADGQSGKNTVTLQTSAEGGRVTVHAPDGGSARAAMLADGNSGSLSVFNVDGSGLAGAALETGKSGAGRLVITDSAGNTMVEAGMLTNTGIGIVRVGPGGFGPAGVTGGVLPASSIQGRK